MTVQSDPVGYVSARAEPSVAYYIIFPPTSSRRKCGNVKAPGATEEGYRNDTIVYMLDAGPAIGVNHIVYGDAPTDIAKKKSPNSQSGTGGGIISAGDDFAFGLRPGSYCRPRSNPFKLDIEYYIII